MSSIYVNSLMRYPFLGLAIITRSYRPLHLYRAEDGSAPDDQEDQVPRVNHSPPSGHARQTRNLIMYATLTSRLAAQEICKINKLAIFVKRRSSKGSGVRTTAESQLPRMCTYIREWLYIVQYLVGFSSRSILAGLSKMPVLHIVLPPLS